MVQKLGFIFVISFVFLGAQVIFAQKSKINLSESKKIFIQRDEAEKYEQFYELLTNELRRKLVFTVVPRIEEADSILKIEFLIDLRGLIFHDNKEFDNLGFRCNLFTKNDEFIWNKDIIIQTKGNFEADNQSAVGMIANKLLKDWLKAKQQKKKSS